METDKWQKRIHKKASDFEKQFIYLPLHVFNTATNIRTIFSRKAKGNEKKLDLEVEAIHKQIGRKYGMWPPEMKNLSFIDTSNTNSNANPIDVEPTNVPNVSVAKVQESTASRKALASTSDQAIPSTSVQAIARTPRALEIVRTPKKTVEPTKEVAPKRVTLASEKSQVKISSISINR